MKANIRSKCLTCGSAGASHMKNMNEYLADVEYFATHFSQVDGFQLVISEIKKLNINSPGSPNFAMEGAAFMLDKIKKMPEINASSVNKFDGKFDLDPEAMNLCSNCRFDIELNEQGNNIKYEFKSWGSVAINKIGTPSGDYFTNQFKAYLADASDISKIQYIFDANKFSDVNAIKTRFKVMFESDPQGIFAIMTPELKSALFQTIDENIQIQIFNSMVLDFNSPLYSFIKL